MGSSLIWDVTQRRLVVTDVSGQPIGAKVKGQSSPRRKPGTLRHTVCRDGVGSERLASSVREVCRIRKAAGEEGIRVAYGLY
jgi:hypothetical protein